MTHTAAISAIILYGVASVLLFFRLMRPSEGGSNLLDRVQRIFLLTGFAAHTVTLVSVVGDPRFTILNNGADYFFWGSWGLAIAYILLSMRVTHPIIGAFLLPGIVLFMGSSSYLLHPNGSADGSTASALVSPATVEMSASGHLLAALHAAPALVAVVSLALAFAVSCVFLIVDRGMKRRSSSNLSLGGPNLQVLDRLNRRLVQIGFVAISLVIVSGGLWAVSEQKPVFTADTSVVSGVAVWLLLAAILHMRFILRWSPKRVSRITVLVTGVFFVSVFAVMFFAGRVTHANL